MFSLRLAVIFLVGAHLCNSSPLSLSLQIPSLHPPSSFLQLDLSFLFLLFSTVQARLHGGQAAQPDVCLPGCSQCKCQWRRERANTWSCRWTHTLHTHCLSLLYQQNESAFWRYLNETEKSPIQPLYPAFINTARHWGDISLPSLTPSVCVHTHKLREVSCSGMMMPPPRLFIPLIPLSRWLLLTRGAFVTSPPPPRPPYTFCSHPLSLYLCLPTPLNGNTHRCVKGRSDSTYPRRQQQHRARLFGKGDRAN